MKNFISFLKDTDEEFSESCMSCGKRTKKEMANDALKAYKKKSREEEIATYGKPINHNNVFKNKKAYTRKLKHKNIEY